MTDLDYDELDKAVNSIASNMPISDNNVVDTASKQTSSTVINNTQQSSENIAAKSTQNGARNRGQFMDVVHPSSNMRKVKSSEQSSEQIVSADPVVSDNKEISFSETKDDDTITSVIASSDKDKKDTDINKVDEKSTKTQDISSDEPLNSPFIPNTKVEKRPLGAFSGNKGELSDEDKPNDNATIAKPKIPLPAELDSDLLKVESDNLVPKEDNSEQLTEEAKPTDTNESKLAEPTDITHQYKEKPSSNDQQTGAIYDPDTYHTGLISPAKKKVGWMTVVWITLLIILGAGAGVVLYIFAIPH